MNSTLMFIFGGVVGILVHKMVSDVLARKKKREIIETINTVLDNLIKNLVDNEEKTTDSDDNDNLLDIKAVLKDLRESESPKDE